jgi:hypothetical protein
MPTPYRPGDTAKTHLCVDLRDLSEPRSRGQMIGPAREGAMAFLQQAVDANFFVSIFSDREGPHIWDWLRIYGKGLQDVIHPTYSPIDADIFLSSRNMLFTGAYPTVDDLEEFLDVSN